MAPPPLPGCRGGEAAMVVRGRRQGGLPWPAPARRRRLHDLEAACRCSSGRPKTRRRGSRSSRTAFTAFVGQATTRSSSSSARRLFQWLDFAADGAAWPATRNRPAARRLSREQRPRRLAFSWEPAHPPRSLKTSRTVTWVAMPPEHRCLEHGPGMVAAGQRRCLCPGS